MEKIKTGDGSYTFKNPDYGEVYHSVSGAEEEATKKYAEPTGLAELAKSGKVRILDICFGIGYNTAAAIDAIRAANPNCEIEVVGLELDDKLSDKLVELEPGFKHYHMIKSIKDGKYFDGKVHIQIHYGDARKKIKEVDGEFDVCFFDPFSPRTQPEMWEEQFFRNISPKLKIKGVLATYSCATHVRLNLVRAGFDVKDGPSIGRRAPSTLAVKVTEPVDEKVFELKK